MMNIYVTRDGSTTRIIGRHGVSPKKITSQMVGEKMGHERFVSEENVGGWLVYGRPTEDSSDRWDAYDGIGNTRRVSVANAAANAQAHTIEVRKQKVRGVGART